MEIALFQADETLRMERVVLYPYPDLKRIWARVLALGGARRKTESRTHRSTILTARKTAASSCWPMPNNGRRPPCICASPSAGATYHAVAELTLGMGDQTELLERQEFDMRLAFRNPDAGDPGFGFGVDLGRDQTQGAAPVTCLPLPWLRHGHRDAVLLAQCRRAPAGRGRPGPGCAGCLAAERRSLPALCAEVHPTSWRRGAARPRCIRPPTPTRPSPTMTGTKRPCSASRHGCPGMIPSRLPG